MSVSKLKGIHRRALGIDRDDRVMAPSGFLTGGDGKASIIYPSDEWTTIFEDFHGDDVTGDDTGKPLYGGPFRALVGDTGHTQDKQAGTNGVHRLFSAVSGGAAKAAASGIGIGTGSLDWKGNQGPGSQSGRLRFGVRIKPENVSRTAKRIHVFAGFTDNAAYEFPAYDTGAGVISNAADYMGFMLSPGGDTGVSGVAGKSTAGDSGDQVVSLDTGPTANAWEEWELEYNRGISDTGGKVTFYVNGRVAGSIDSPISPTVALMPCVYGFQQDTGGEYVDNDWIAVSAPRDTGL